MGRWPQWNTGWCPPANLSDVMLVVPGLKGVSFGSIVRTMIGGACTVGPAKTKDVIGEANLSTIFICGNRIGHRLSMVAGLAQSNATILVFLEGPSYLLLEMRVHGGVHGVGVVVGGAVVVGAPRRPVGCVMVLTVVPCVDPKDGRDDGLGILGMVGCHGEQRGE